MDARTQRISEHCAQCQNPGVLNYILHMSCYMKFPQAKPAYSERCSMIKWGWKWED